MIESLIPLPFVSAPSTDVTASDLLELERRCRQGEARYVATRATVRFGTVGTDKRLEYGSFGIGVDHLLKAASGLKGDESWISSDLRRDLSVATRGASVQMAGSEWMRVGLG